MILELAELRIQHGKQNEFDEAIQRGLETVMSKSPGYRGHRVQRGIESPDRYLLIVYWDSVEAHTVGFRQSPLFDAWRAIVSPYFAAPPQVEHFTLLTEATR